MRTLTIAIILLSLTAPSFSQYMAAVPAATAPAVSRVTLELKDMPLKSAIEQVVKFSSAEYKLDPALDQPPYDGIIVSIRLVNVPYYEALGTLLNAHGLEVKVADSIRIIQPAETRQAVAAVFADPDLVSMTIPRMSISEALRYLYSGAGKTPAWNFQGVLGSAIMPGATFRQFPREEAADVLLVAAGLVPPTGNDRLVKSVGKADLSGLISYVPGGCFSGLVLALRASSSPAVAIASYKTAGSTNLKLVVLANQERDTVVLDNVLSASGMSYVMGDLRGGTEASAGPKLVSIRLYGVTPDQTLKSILPAMGLRHRMQGLTIFIEAAKPEPPEWVKPALSQPLTPP